MEEIALGVLGMTEDQLWKMTPRTFTNILKGRDLLRKKEQAEWHQRQIMHQELVLAMLSPHMKKADRDKAYKELSALAKKEAQPEKKTQKGQNPIEFWEEVDKKLKS